VERQIMPEASQLQTEDPSLLRPLLVGCQVIPREVRQYLRIQNEQGLLDKDPVASCLMSILNRHRPLLNAQSDFSYHNIPVFWTAVFLGSAITIVLAFFFLPNRPAQEKEIETFIVLAYTGGMTVTALIASFLHLGESFWGGWAVDIELGLATGFFVLPGTNLLLQVFSTDLPLVPAILKGIFMGLIGAITFSPIMALSGGSQMGGMPGRLLAMIIKEIIGVENVDSSIKEAVEPYRTVIQKTIENSGRTPTAVEKENDQPPPD
jgi:hypothetical protein